MRRGSCISTCSALPEMDCYLFQVVCWWLPKGRFYSKSSVSFVLTISSRMVLWLNPSLLPALLLRVSIPFSLMQHWTLALYCKVSRFFCFSTHSKINFNIITEGDALLGLLQFDLVPGGSDDNSHLSLHIHRAFVHPSHYRSKICWRLIHYILEICIGIGRHYLVLV